MLAIFGQTPEQKRRPSHRFMVARKPGREVEMLNPPQVGQRLSEEEALDLIEEVARALFPECKTREELAQRVSMLLLAGY